MPERLDEGFFLLVDDGQADVRQKIFRVGAEHTLENVSGIGVGVLLKKGLSQKAVGADETRIAVEDVTAVGNGLPQPALVNQRINFLEIVV